MSKTSIGLSEIAALPHPLSKTQPQEFVNEDDNDASKQANGRWKKAEHKLFVEGLNKYGKSWNKVANYVKTRNATQVRSHAQKYFLKCSARKAKKLPAQPNVKKEKTNDKSNESNSSIDHLKITERVNGLEKLNEFAMSQLKTLLEAGISFQSQLRMHEEFKNIVRGALDLADKVVDNPQAVERCLRVSNAATLAVLYLANRLEKAENLDRECAFLIQYMQKYGFTDFTQIASSYTKLSDWVNTVLELKH